MSTHDWQPGDVAVWEYPDATTSAVALRVDQCPVAPHADGPHWHTSTGGWLGDDRNLRPLVVIDPEDREAVARLAARYAATVSARLGDEYLAWENRSAGARERITTDLTTALHEFANPTPPKPAEPTGLGAVVEDSSGLRWVRGSESTTTKHWRCARDIGSGRRPYADINAVTVLSEGVQS